MKIRVMGFPQGTSKDHIEKLFSVVGTVTEVKKKKSKNTDYVIMSYEQQARKSVKLLNGANLMGKKIRVKECLSGPF